MCIRDSLFHAPDRMASASKQNNFTGISPCFGSCSGLRDGRYRRSSVHDHQSGHHHRTLHRRSRCRVVAQHGRNRDCFDAGLCRIEQLDLREKTDLFFVTPFSILELSLPSFFPQFSFKFGVILENNRSLKKQRLRIY